MMSMPGGYMGKVLFVDLTSNAYEERALTEDIYREFIGGYGLGVRVLYERMKAGVDPLGPQNILGFVAGTLTGTKCHGAGRFNVVAKSPLTNGWGDSSCGGNFGPVLKSTGYDGVFITGRAKKPVYLWITDGAVEIRDAGHLWGKDSSEAEDIIKREGDSGAAVALIGQAGENLSKIAAIMHDYGRAAGRSGLGAVMGSKLLKAVAVKGGRQVPVADEYAYRAVLARMGEDIKTRTRLANNIGKLGTVGIYLKNITIQDAPIQNWKGIAEEVYPLEKASNLGGDVYLQYMKRKYACAQCAIVCGAILEMKEADGKTYLTHRPEYETVAAFGSMCLVDDPETVIKVNELCNRCGFDTISAGATVAFAMECYEKGLITEKDTDGLSLEWGNKDAVIPLIEMMRDRKGIGALLADGVKAAAEKIGQAAEEFAIHVGGQELGMHDPRCWPGFGYGYVLDPTPGRHTTGGVGFIEHGWSDKELAQFGLDDLGSKKYDYNSKGKPLAILNKWFQFFNSAGMCLFTKFGYNHYPLLEAFQAVTGWKDFDLEEALVAGERINTLRHCFNLREGLEPQTFRLPPRAQGIPPLKAGPTAGVTIDIETVRRSYYQEMEWDLTTGLPSPRKLETLNLAGLVSDLKSYRGVN